MVSRAEFTPFNSTSAAAGANAADGGAVGGIHATDASTIRSDAAAASAKNTSGSGGVGSRCMCPAAGTLRFTLVPGDNAPLAPATHTVLLSSGCSGGVSGGGTAPGADGGEGDSLQPCSASDNLTEEFIAHCVSMYLNGERYYNYSASNAASMGNIAVVVEGWAPTIVANTVSSAAQIFEVNYCV